MTANAYAATAAPYDLADDVTTTATAPDPYDEPWTT